MLTRKINQALKIAYYDTCAIIPKIYLQVLLMDEVSCVSFDIPLFYWIYLGFHSEYMFGWKHIALWILERFKTIKRKK